MFKKIRQTCNRYKGNSNSDKPPAIHHQQKPQKKSGNPFKMIPPYRF